MGGLRPTPHSLPTGSRLPKCVGPVCRPPSIHLARIAQHWLAGDLRAPSRGSIPGVPLPQCASPFRVPQGAAPHAPLDPLGSASLEAGWTPKFPRGCRKAGEERAWGAWRGPRTAALSLTWAAPPWTARGAARSSHQPPPAAATATATSRALPYASPPRIPVRMARVRASCKGRARQHVLEQVRGRRGRSTPVPRVPSTSLSSGPPQTLSTEKCLGAPQIRQVVPLEPSGNCQLSSVPSLPGQASTICTVPHTFLPCQVSSPVALLLSEFQTLLWLPLLCCRPYSHCHPSGLWLPPAPPTPHVPFPVPGTALAHTAY